MLNPTTTIAAIATPPGRGGVGVIRLSGPKSYEIAQALTRKDLPKPDLPVFASSMMRQVKSWMKV